MYILHFHCTYQFTTYIYMFNFQPHSQYLHPAVVLGAHWASGSGSRDSSSSSTLVTPCRAKTAKTPPRGLGSWGFRVSGLESVGKGLRVSGLGLRVFKVQNLKPKQPHWSLTSLTWKVDILPPTRTSPTISDTDSSIMNSGAPESPLHSTSRDPKAKLVQASPCKMLRNFAQLVFKNGLVD